jgi:hypothetical protein
MQNLWRWSNRVSIRPEDVCGKHTSECYRTLLKTPADAKHMSVGMSEVSRSGPESSVQGSVLNGFCDVLGLNRGRAFEIGDGS